MVELVEAADMNGLLRVIDGLCGAREWDALVELANRCEEATERGKQLWPIAAHIDYRIALHGPPEYAAGVLTAETARFAHGPLTEVAASSHSWDDLAPWIDLPQVAAYVAQERVLRGEDLTGDERAHPGILELPLRLQEWEPTYALATFLPSDVEVAEPWEPKEPMAGLTPVSSGEDLRRPAVEEALLDLVHAWTSESNGAARAVVVRGNAVEAASRLTYGELRMGRIEPEEALQRMAWAAAAGGAHGRRRGAAIGRFSAWYAAATLAGLEWPPRPGDLGAAVRRLEWWRWDEGEPESGWVLRVAVEDPDGGWAAAVGATDFQDEDAAG